MPDAKVKFGSAADRVFERSRLERPCSGEAYVQWPPIHIQGEVVSNSYFNDMYLQIPVSPLRVSFDEG
jgi:hypothetical protein